MEIEFLTVNSIDFRSLKEPQVPSSCCQKEFASFGTLLNHFEIYHYSILKEIVRLKQYLFLRCLNEVKLKEPVIKIEESEVSEELVEQNEVTTEEILDENSEIKPNPSPFSESSEEEQFEFTIPKRKRSKRSKEPVDHRRYECNKCDRIIIGIKNYRRHQNRHKIFYICDLCDKKFLVKDKLESHIFMHRYENPENKNLACKLCEIIFDDELEKSLHLEEYHIQSSEILECNLCPSFFTNKFQLVSHVRRIHERKVLTCKYCYHKKFQTLQDLELHIFEKHQDSTVLCSHCGKSFNSKPQLRNHLDDLQPKKFNCVVCGKTFNKKCYLDRHQNNVHGIGEMNFTCVTCNKGFAKLSDLRSHEISHSDATPFKCSECPMAFKRRYHLNVHMENIHTEGFDAKCVLCEKVLKTKHTLRSHAIKVHKMTMNEMYKAAGIPYKGRDCMWSKFYLNRKSSDIRINV